VDVVTEPNAPEDGQVDGVEDAWVDGADDAWVEDAESETHTALPPKVEAWRRRSATGAILTGFALGLQNAFEPPRKEPAIVMQTSGDPPMDLPVEAELEQAGPRHTVVKVRPWLLEGADVDEPADGDGSARGGSN
jgi:hypothetical protein